MPRERENWKKNTVNLSPPEHFLGRVRTGHMRWMDPLVRGLFISQKTNRGRWKKQSHDNKRTTNNASRVHNDQHRDGGTPHSTLYSCQETQCISAPSVGCGVLSDVVSKAYVKNVRKLSEVTTPARYKRHEKEQTARRASVGPNK